MFNFGFGSVDYFANEDIGKNMISKTKNIRRKGADIDKL